jgi:hypothetical protein
MPNQQQIDHWRSLVDGHNSSDESVAQYGARHRVHAATFYGWRKRFAERTEFIEVCAAPPPTFEVRMTSGVVVCVPANFDDASSWPSMPPRFRSKPLWRGTRVGALRRR